MAQIKHSGGIVDAIMELGFDQVKYFEDTITETASGFTISPPARRLIIENTDATNDVYLRINDSPATTSVSFSPGDNIKIRANCTFTMDFDALTEISLVTASSITVAIQGVLGFKGTKNTGLI